MGTTSALLTFEEFERLPDRPGKRELLKGEPIEVPPADANHNDIAERIFLFLRSAVIEAHARGVGEKLGRARMEAGYHLSGEGWVQPDVSVTHAGQPQEKYLEGSPAIAIEVISPSNSAESLAVKTELYFELGALEVARLPKDASH